MFSLLNKFRTGFNCRLSVTNYREQNYRRIWRCKLLCFQKHIDETSMVKSF